MNNKQFLLTQLLWIGISFGISLTLSIIFPFYISLPLTIAVFIGLSYYMRRRMARGQNIGFTNPFNKQVNFYCMQCSHRHNKIECPRCGSRLKKAGF